MLFTKLRVTLLLVLAVSSASLVTWRFASAAPSPTIGRTVTPGNMGPCTWFLSLDGTTPVAEAMVSGLSVGVGDNVVGTAGQDPAAFFVTNLASNQAWCLAPNTRFTGSSTFDINAKSNVLLRGGGYSTLLTIANNVNNPVIRVLNSNNVTIENLGVDGNKAGQTTGPTCTGGSPVCFGILIQSSKNAIITNSFISNSATDNLAFVASTKALVTNIQSNNAAFDDYIMDINSNDNAVANSQGTSGTFIEVHGKRNSFSNMAYTQGTSKAGANAIYTDNSYNIFSNIQITNYLADSSTSAGLLSDVGSADNVASQIHIEGGNLTYGILFKGSGVISGNTLKGASMSNSVGIPVESANVTVTSNYVEGGWTNQGIIITTSDDVITGNRVWGANTGITDAGGSARNIITGNDVRGNVVVGIDTIGSNSLVINNLGFNPAPIIDPVTAGASPWTYTNNDGYPETMILKTVNGQTAETCNGIGVVSPTTAGQSCYLAPGTQMTATWATTAPVYRKVPS